METAIYLEEWASTETNALDEKIATITRRTHI